MSRRTTTCCPGARTLDNVLFSLEVQGKLDDASRARAEKLIQAVGLAGFEKYYPHELSGGMRKRTALIRTLVYDPPIILMDEPFAAVDAQTRTQLQADLLRLWDLGRKTIIFVTHDITEAIALGDRALVLSQAAVAHRRRARDPDPAPAQREGHLRAAGLCGDLREDQGGRAMTRCHTATIADATGRLASSSPQMARLRRPHRRWRSRCSLGLGIRRAHARAAVLRAAARDRAAHRGSWR